MPTHNSLKWSPWKISDRDTSELLGFNTDQLFGVGMVQDLNTPFFNIYFKEIEKPIAT